MDKQEWRTRLRANRRARSADERNLAGEGIANLAGRLPTGVDSPIERPITVLAFYNTRFEPPTSQLLAALVGHYPGCRILIPAPGPELTDLQFAFHTPGTQPVLHGSIPEPAGERLDASILRQAGLALIPALAVDRSGTRLGQGGGWYDRVLGELRPNTPVYAVVFSDEVFPPGTLPKQDHDFPIQGALTPGALIKF